MVCLLVERLAKLVHAVFQNWIVNIATKMIPIFIIFGFLANLTMAASVYIFSSLDITADSFIVFKSVTLVR